ncbi:indolepyruvate oxidoreductase subunit beta [Desulfobacula sp.]|uniref:indolepyruvate oxidoreductase subunit beta n=1 Tax=Desulfobacula sp. TaxID=2593537 RepID=UPI0026032CAC|nr:indolepyruvate oxidoreductase subunit beta [Desulfobacula sp.]
MKQSINTIITGVGGQGNVLAAKLLAAAALADGWEVSVGDVYGLSQRGGSVASHIRWNRDRMMPPLVPEGDLDFLLAFEPLEALRIMTQYGNKHTVVVVNDHPVNPVGVQAGRFLYPDVEALYRLLEKMSKKVWWVSGTDTAKSLGNIQFLNTIMLGTFFATGQLGIRAELFEDAIRQTVPARYALPNIAAFSRGKALCSRQ